jgi:hypothetical protein
MIVSMIRSGIFRVSWLLQTLDRHPFRIFSRDRATHHALHEDLVNHIWIHAENNPITNPGNNPISKQFLFIWL